MVQSFQNTRRRPNPPNKEELLQKTSWKRRKLKEEKHCYDELEKDGLEELKKLDKLKL